MKKETVMKFSIVMILVLVFYLLTNYVFYDIVCMNMMTGGVK